jgi:hypothetical protein
VYAVPFMPFRPKFVKVATPLTALTDLVPIKAPPELMLAVTVAEEFVTVLPLAV